MADETVLTDGEDEVDEILDQWRAERPDLDPTPMGVFGRLTRVRTLAEGRLTATLERFGLSLSSFDVLANLRRSGPPFQKTPSELASSSMLTSGGITFRLDRLESDGLIRRVPSDTDRRVVYAQLTPSGHELIDEVIAAHLATEAAMLEGLDGREIELLCKLLRKLTRSIRAAMLLGEVDAVPSGASSDPRR